MGLHVFFGCYFNLFRLMAKCGVLENLLVKVGRGAPGRWGLEGRGEEAGRARFVVRREVARAWRDAGLGSARPDGWPGTFEGSESEAPRTKRSAGGRRAR